MTKIVLSGSGRGDLIFPSKIHMKCIKFPNSQSENINESNLSNTDEWGDGERIMLTNLFPEEICLVQERRLREVIKISCRCVNMTYSEHSD
jgi:hypothetical protein